MKWNFWKKTDQQKAGPGPVTLSSPVVIPEPVAKYMVVDMKKEAEWVWRLKAVERPHATRKKIYDVRVFDPNDVSAKKVHIKDFNSLNAHPELIVFEGCYSRKTRVVEPAPTWIQMPKAA